MRWAVLAVAVGLVSRIALIILLADREATSWPDSIEYMRHATNLLDRGLYSFDGVQPDRMRQPLFPFFVAGIYAVFGRDNLFVYGVQTIIGGGAIALTWRLARLLGLSPSAAGLAGLIVALYPPYVRIAGMVGTETLSTFLWLVTALVLCTVVRTERGWHALVLGGVVGLHALCRPMTAFVLPLLLGGLRYGGLGWRRTLRAGGLACVAFGLVVLPWGVRNAVTLGTPTILSTEGGVTLYLGLRPDRERIWANEIGRFIESAEGRTLIGDDYYISSAADAVFRREAAKLFLRDPVGAIRRGVWGSVKSWLYMPGGLTVTRGRPWLWIPVVAVPTTLLLLALYGGLGLESRVGRVLIVGLPVYFTAAHIPAIAQPRFMLPLFPFIAIGAVAGLQRLRVALEPAGGAVRERREVRIGGRCP
jgi:hypothetical protein